MALREHTDTRNAKTDAAVARLNGGSLKIYTGSQPAAATDAATGTLLATVALANPAFGASANGTATATDPASVNASASGTAGWFRAVTSGGATVFDGSVTASGAGGDMTLSSTALTSGAAVDITSFTYTQPA